jgi:hypothetical protein
MTVPTYKPFKVDEGENSDDKASGEGSDEGGLDNDNDKENDEDDTPLTSPINSALFVPPPSMEAAKVALTDLGLLLRPPRQTGAGYKNPKLDLLLRHRLEQMQVFLRKYTDHSHGANGWMAASLQTAKDHGSGTSQAQRLHEWVHDFIADHQCLPINVYSTWNTSILKDKDFALELQLHLQGIGKYVKAMDIVHYVDQPEVKIRLNLTKTISLATAQWWMRTVVTAGRKLRQVNMWTGTSEMMSLLTGRRCFFPSGQKCSHVHGCLKMALRTEFLTCWAVVLSSGTMMSQLTMPMTAKKFVGSTNRRHPFRTQKAKGPR